MKQAISEGMPMSTRANKLADKQAFLSQFLQENATRLQGIISSYVARAGVAYGEAIQVVAQEVFHEMTIEALAHADRFDLTTLPWAWLLAIALNIIKRRKARESKRHLYELPVSELAPTAVSELDFFDQVTKRFAPGADQVVATEEQAREILALVSASDAHVLRLSIVDGLTTEQLAYELGINQVAARVRLHRALKRLRSAWQRYEKRGEDYA